MPQNPDSTRQATRLHHTLRAAVRARRCATHAIAHGLFAMRESRLYQELGYAGLAEYAESEFGFAPGKTQQLARAGDRLRDLPALDRALASGALGWTKVRTVVIVATPETEQAWLELASTRTSRELEDLVSRATPGDAPPDDADTAIEDLEYAWASIRFEKHHYEQLMRAAVRLRQRLGDPDLSLSQLLLVLAERELERADEDEVFAPPRGENAYRENYRIIEHRCPECDRAWTEGHAGRQEMTREARELVECDCEVIHGDAGHEKAGHVSRESPPAVRRAVLVRDEGRCQVPGCRHQRFLDLHHIQHRAHGGDHDPDNLTTVCGTHHDLLHRDVLRIHRTPDGALTWERGGGEPLAVRLRVGIDRQELDHDYLSEFTGGAGEWPLLDDEDRAREHVYADRGDYPRGVQSIVLGDLARPGTGWDGRYLPTR